MNELNLEKKYCVKYSTANHVDGTYDNFDFYEALKNAKLVSQLLVRLPSGPGYKLSDIAKIVKILKTVSLDNLIQKQFVD